MLKWRGKKSFCLLLAVLGSVVVLLARPTFGLLFLNVGTVLLHKAVLASAEPTGMETVAWYLEQSERLAGSAATLRNEGIAALERTDTVAAEHLLAQAVAREPDDPLVLWYQGQLYLATGRRSEAIQVLRAARAQEYFLQAGETEYRAGRMTAAREQYELYLEMAPGDAYALRRIGESYQAEGELDLALQYYGASLGADPSSHRTYYLMGTVHRARGEWEQAIELYEQAIEYAPDELMYYLVVGQTYDEVGRSNDAARWYMLARQVAPDSELPYLYYGVSLLNQRRVDEALVQLELAIGHKRDNCLAHLYYGFALRHAGRFEEALEAFRLAAPYEGCSRSAHMGMGAIYQETGRLDQAEAEYRLVLSLFPDFAPAQEALDLLMQERQR